MTLSKEKQNETALKNQISGTNPENPQPYNDDIKNVTKLSETVVATTYLSVKENDLAIKMSKVIACEEAINKMYASITSSNNNLTPIAKAKLRNDINEKKEEKKTLKALISKLSKELKKEYQKNASGFTKKSLRISARKESYQKRYGNSIQNAISKMISALDSDNLTALKAELAKLSEKAGNALVMKVLLKAPRHLHTKVVANTVAREEYLQFFRSELGATKKAAKGRGRNKK